MTEKKAQEGKAEKAIAVINDSGEFANLMDTNRFEHLWRIATLFSKTELVPKHYQGKPENCMIAIEMAMRMNMAPLPFLQNTYIVHGRPGIEAKLAITLINSSGLFVDSLDYEIEGEDPHGDNYRVRAYAVKRSTGKTIFGPWVDWKMVKAEGWLGKEGSKWKTMPGIMFSYRAAMFFGRLHCPERLLGMQTVDELQDVGPRGEIDVTPPQTLEEQVGLKDPAVDRAKKEEKKTATRGKKGEEAQTVEATEEKQPGTEKAEAKAETAATGPRKELHDLLGEICRGDIGEMSAYLTSCAGRRLSVDQIPQFSDKMAVDLLALVKQQQADDLEFAGGN